MAVNTTDPLQNGTTQITDRGHSMSVWRDFPVAEILENPSAGIYVFDDFTNTPDVAAGAVAVYGNYHGFASTGGSVADAGVSGGVKTLSSDGDNEGASIAQISKSFFISRDHKLLCFEARIKKSLIEDTEHGFFIGLIDACTLSATVPIAAAGTLADENFVGFHNLEGDGDKLDVVYKADGVTQVTLAADAVTLVADTWVKVGFRFEPTNSIGKWYIRFFYDNVEVASARYQVVASAGTDFPNDAALGMVFAVLNATGTTPGSSSIDWWACGQLF